MIDVALPIALRTALAGQPVLTGAKPVQSIGIVGGLFADDDYRTEICENDLKALQRIFNICRKKGIVISPDVRVGIANKYYDDDFLEEPPEIDLAAFSHINHNKFGYGGVSKLLCQSHLALEPGIWYDSSVKSGARYLFNFYSKPGLSLPNELLEGEAFKLDEIFPAGPDQILNCALFCR